MGQICGAVGGITAFRHRKYNTLAFLLLPSRSVEYHGSRDSSNQYVLVYIYCLPDTPIHSNFSTVFSLCSTSTTGVSIDDLQASLFTKKTEVMYPQLTLHPS
jgi:hypothetical protein